jgi:hypothetical protein
MNRAARFALIFALVASFGPVGAVRAATYMPIGFFDDPSFRWSPQRGANLLSAASTGASIIHTNASWPAIAPTRPADPSDPADPAYKLDDLNDLVYHAAQFGLRVMINVTGTPKWANGGQTPNHLPKRLSDLTAFTKMLASTYNGAPGHGSVNLYSVWNEPNLQLFLTPQFVGKKIVGPANYAKLYKAAYAGIKAGNPRAKVAIGETSARGRDKPLGTNSATVAPGTFARLLSQVKGLRFDAWAHHPYPTALNLPPTQKVRYPNVTLSTLPQFEADLKKWFHRSVPIWITEYGHETKPGEPHGVTPATQAAYARQALAIARKDQNVQMFTWFTLRDSAGNPWQSGLQGPSGAHKPSFNTFSALARVTAGSMTAARAGTRPRITVFVPYLSFYSQAGSVIGVTYTVYDGSRTVTSGQTQIPLAADQSVTFTPTFAAAKKHSYRVVVTANEVNGHSESATVGVTTT